MSDDGIKTGKSTSKGKNKAGQKEQKPAQVEVEVVEQVDSQIFQDTNLISRGIQIQTKLIYLAFMKGIFIT